MRLCCMALGDILLGIVPPVPLVLSGRYSQASGSLSLQRIPPCGATPRPALAA